MENRLGQTVFDALSPMVLRTVDFVLVIAAFVVAHYLRYGHFDIRFEYQMLMPIAAFMVLASVSVFGNYTSWRGRHQLELAGRIFIAWFLAFLFLFALLAMSKRGEDFSRLWIGYAFAISLVAAVVVRVLIYALLGFFRAQGYNQRRVMLVGESSFVSHVFQKLNSELGSGFNAVCAADTSLKPIHGLKAPNSLEQLDTFLDAEAISEVWVCLSLSESSYLEMLMFSLRHSTVNVRFVPDVSAFRLLNHKVDFVAGISTLDLSYSPLYGFNGFIKRIEDIVVASSITLAVLPLVIPIAIAVRLSGPGPIIFKQLRLGADGKTINIYKFRTMNAHDDSHVKQAVKDDDRVTKVGKFLRRTSLDELPQFYNVLQGRMSVVGPRPHAIAHNEHYKELVESYMQRHRVKPGITGWAQINGLRGETDTLDKMQKRVEFDLYYIENWSLFLDFKIIILTAFKIFSDENAY